MQKASEAEKTRSSFPSFRHSFSDIHPDAESVAMSLQGKWVLLTGAAGGIGQALARELALAGCNLILTSRNRRALITLQKEIRTNGCLHSGKTQNAGESEILSDCISSGSLSDSPVSFIPTSSGQGTSSLLNKSDEKRYPSVQVIPVVLDLGEAEACRRLYDLLKEKQISVDILINNAGVGDHCAFVDSEWRRIANIIDLNIRALTELSWLFGRDMQKHRSGSIINIASVASFAPGPYLAVYYASKAYVLSLSLALEQELKADHIQVCAVCPQRTASNFDQQAHMHRKASLQQKKSADPAVLARKIVHAILQQRSLVLDGSMTMAMVSGSRLLGDRQMAAIMKKLNEIPKEQQ